MMMTSASQAHASPCRRVLIVEDDDLTRLTYKLTLREHEDEFACRMESSGEGALAYLRGQDPDAVVLDWDLPGISGLEVLKSIRSNPATTSVPVLMVTGRNGPEDEETARQSGASAYRSKPVSGEDLLDGLRTLCSEPPDATPPRWQ